MISYIRMTFLKKLMNILQIAGSMMNKAIDLFKTQNQMEDSILIGLI